MKKRAPKKFDWKSLVTTSIVVLSHIALILVLFMAKRYYAIYPALFNSLIGILICLVMMIDIAFVMSTIHRDTVIKIITTVICFFMLIGSSVGVYYVGKVNKTVSSVIGTNTSNDSKYETVTGTFVVLEKNESKYKEYQNFAGKKIGLVKESETGAATVAKDILANEKIDYAVVEFDTYDELIISLNDEKIDVGVFINGYRSIYEKNALEGGSDYTGIISKFADIMPYEKQVEAMMSDSNKDISKDPFNILLIGYSRTEIGSPIGLADAIIVASVNPQTYTVSMMSIARDSYVPISCYGGTKDKINSARGTSRSCFIKTVEDYTNMKMDFYMEADYEAVVEVVNALEGIVITNPVAFTLDGIYVEEGTYNAWGWEVLQFCRERHHMPNGDFDRQQHQKEVIIAIAEKLIRKADITLFLNAMEAAGDKFSTNLTLNQLTGMFNMILNTKNYTGLKVSKLIDFHQLRLTGYADWYYNEGMQLPLWIYKIYQGSYKESMEHASYVLGEKVNTNDQIYDFEFDVNEGYDRALFYSLSYNEEEVHEVLPPYYPNFVGMTYEDAYAYCKEHGISPKWSFITRADAYYNEDRDGYVIDQSLRYGIKVSNGTITLTVMGNGKAKLPNCEGWTLEEAKNWCKENSYEVEKPYSVRYCTKDEGLDGQVISMEFTEDDKIKIKYYVEISDYVGKKIDNVPSDVNKEVTETLEGASASNVNVVKSQKISEDRKIVEFVVYNFNKHDHVYSTNGTVAKEPTCTEKGEMEYKCTVEGCTKKKTEEIAINPDNHNFEVVSTTATCTEGGIEKLECSRCHTKKDGNAVGALGHSFTDYVYNNDATAEANGTETATCDHGCGESNTREAEGTQLSAETE